MMLIIIVISNNGDDYADLGDNDDGQLMIMVII